MNICNLSGGSIEWFTVSTPLTQFCSFIPCVFKMPSWAPPKNVMRETENCDTTIHIYGFLWFDSLYILHVFCQFGVFHIITLCLMGNVKVWSIWFFMGGRVRRIKKQKSNKVFNLWKNIKQYQTEKKTLLSSTYKKYWTVVWERKKISEKFCLPPSPP